MLPRSPKPIKTLAPTTLPSSLIPDCSNRPGDDPIFALNALANARVQAGEDILNATLGALVTADGVLAVLPSVEEAYRRIPFVQASCYAPISGPPAFVGAIIRDLFGDSEYARQAVGVSTPGGTGAVHHAIVNTLEPGQNLLTSSYYWGPYAILANHTRRGVSTFRMFDEGGRFDVQSYADGLNEMMSEQGRALVILNTPCHNPTGYTLDDEEWGQIVEITEQAASLGPVSFLLDFAYEKFAPPGQSIWRNHIERLSASVGVFIAWTASKSFAQYGARIGALIALHPDDEQRSRLANALGYSCRGTWSNCNTHGMLAVAEVLSDPELCASSEEERRGLVSLLDDRVTIFNEHARPAGLKYPRYEGGFFVTVFTPDEARTAESMREDGVFVVPLPGAVRVALCATPKVKVPRLVESLVKGIEAAH